MSHPLASPRPLTAALALTLALVAGCGPGLYDLPVPPPPHSWVAVSLDPAQEDRNDEQRTLDARGAVLELYQALNEEDWGQAWDRLSTETQNFLAFGSATKDGRDALAQGRLIAPDGVAVEIDPVDLFVVRDMTRLDDDLNGTPDATETANRKEFHATGEDGQIHKIVVIYEIGQWRIHRTRATD